MAGVWNFLQWSLVLGDTALSLLCCFKKLGFNNTLIRNTIKKSFVSDWPETLKIGLLLLPTVTSMTLQKKPATHHLLYHLLNRPSSQCQMQSRLTLSVSSISETRVMQQVTLG